jgi:hypothetical protein
MSHNVIETDEFPATVPVTDVDDITYPTVEADMGTRLAKRTRYAHNTLTGNASFDALDFAGLSGQLATQYVIPTTRLGANNLWTVNVTRLAQSLKWLKERTGGTQSGAQFFNYGPFAFSAVGWSPAVNGAGVPAMSEASPGITSVLYVPLPGLPRAGTITAIHARVLGVGHGDDAGDLPANMPVMTLVAYTVTSPSGAIAATTLATVTDTSATGAIYDADHALSLTGLSVDLADPVPPLYHLIRIAGEYGSNSVAHGFQFYGLQVQVAAAT